MATYPSNGVRSHPPAGVVLACWLIAAVGSATPGDLADQDPARVEGRIVDAEGAPITGATIEVVDNKRRFNQRRKTFSDAEGFYSLQIDGHTKRIRLAASAPDYLATSTHWILQPGESDLDFELTKVTETTNHVAGKVVDEAGEPIAGVEVEAFTPVQGFHSSFSMPTGRDFFPGPDRVTATDERGHFRIDDVTQDKVQLSLRCKHRHVNDKNYSVGDGVVIRMSGSGEPGVLRGQLLDDETGEPIDPSTPLRIVRRHRTETHSTLDDRARFELSRTATLGNRYSAYVYAGGYAATSARWEARAANSSEHHEIRLKRSPALKVRFLDATTGEPIPGVRVLYGQAEDAFYFEWTSYDRYTDGHHSLKYVQHATTDAEGHVWFAEPTELDNPVLIGWAEGYQRYMLAKEQLATDPESGETIVWLHREAVITGVITKGEEPVPNTSVSVGGDKLFKMEPWYPSVRTDAQGRYRLGSLAPGSYRLVANGCIQNLEVEPASEHEVNLGADIGKVHIHGRAPAGATITLSPDFKWEYRSLSVIVSEEGEYELTGLKAGRYRVRMIRWTNGHRQRMRAAEIQVTPEGGRVDLQWRPPKPPPPEPTGSA